MQSFWSFLRDELQTIQGRCSYTLRLTLSCAVLITLFMTLQIPFLAVALIVVFYVSQPNVMMIKLVSIVFFITISIALGGVLLIIKWTYDFPLVRLVVSVFLFFGAIYLMRVLGKLGLAFFVVALAVIYAQTFPSMTSQSEILVRLLLWLWVAINCAVAVTLLVNVCFQQAFPSNQLRTRLATIFRQVAGLLVSKGNVHQRPDFKDVAGQFTQLQTLFKLASLSNSEVSNEPERWRSLMATAIHCYQLTALFEPRMPMHSQQTQQIASVLNVLADSLEDGKQPDVQPFNLTDDTQKDVILYEMAEYLNALARSEAVPMPAGDVEPSPLLLPDAWSNPAYLHFALKTLLATLICYVFYTAADWQGIHTIMLSCVIVAQPGLGATMQKMLLRIGGALFATLIALLLIVFVLPHTESLTGLLMMVLPVIAFCAWIAAGSERIAYAGIQIAFTFSLAFLSWFGPQYNLTELRDRVIGILLGLLVSSIVHLYLWPDSEAPQLKTSLAAFYRRVAGYLSVRKEEAEIVPLFQALIYSESLMYRVAAEPLNAYVHPYPEAKTWPVQQVWSQALEIVRLSEGYRMYASPDDIFLSQCATQLQAYAGYIEQLQDVLPRYEQVVPNANNPFGPLLCQALAMLPDWAPAPTDTLRQVE